MSRTGLRAIALIGLLLTACGTLQQGGAPPKGAGPPPTGRLVQGGEVAPPRYDLAAVAAVLPIAGVTASHNQVDAPKAIDGLASTIWESSYKNRDPHITFALAEPHALTQVGTYVNPWVGAYDVQVSMDGVTWTTVLANVTNAYYRVETKNLPAATVGQYVRLQFRNAGHTVRVYEARVVGASLVPATPPPTPVPTPTPPVGVPAAFVKAESAINTANTGLAIDGLTSTLWESAHTNRNPSMLLTLNGYTSLSSVGIFVNPWFGNYDVDVSPDGNTWQTVLAGVTNTYSRIETKPLPPDTFARYVRLRFTNSGHTVRVYEVKANGVTIEPPPPTPPPLPPPPPWFAPTDALVANMQAAGLVPLRTIERHDHGHLYVFYEGAKVFVPGLIGIGANGSFVTGVHTHDDTGKLHIEGMLADRYNLWQFFAQWGISLAAAQIYVDGVQVYDPREVELVDGITVAVVFGTPPDVIPALPPP